MSGHIDTIKLGEYSCYIAPGSWEILKQIQLGTASYYLAFDKKQHINWIKNDPISKTLYMLQIFPYIPQFFKKR